MRRSSRIRRMVRMLRRRIRKTETAWRKLCRFLCFSAPIHWGTRIASAIRTVRAGVFSAPAERGARTASACSPLTGGEVFAEPQRRVALCGARETAAPAAGAKRKGHLRFPFLFELLPFPYFLSWRKSETGDRFEIRGTAVGLPQRVFLRLFAVHRQRTATHVVYSTQARHTRVAQILGTL